MRDGDLAPGSRKNRLARRSLFPALLGGRRVFIPRTSGWLPCPLCAARDGLSQGWRHDGSGARIAHRCLLSESPASVLCPAELSRLDESCSTCLLYTSDA